jgi:cysteine desulfurase NifS
MMSEQTEQVLEASKETATEIKNGLCGICPAGCWVQITLEDGRIQKVERQPDHPLGMICTNGTYSAEIVYDEKRLRYPLKRVGPKGTYEFERISWDDAFEIITERLQAIKRESGPEATAIYTGRGGFELSLCDIFQPAEAAVSSASSVLFPFGSPNTLGVGALCYVSFAMIAPHTTMGEMYITTDSDVEQAELIVVWGANPATDSPPLAHEQIMRARERGAEVIVIDPRRIETAYQTDAEWIPIRPGTDGALALGLIQVLIEEEIYDEDFVTNWTRGWPELQQYVQHFRAEQVEEITGVPAETVRKLARRIASARGACPITYTGLEYSDSGVQAIRALFTFWALAGQLDVPGGLVFRMKENQFPINRDGLIPNPNPLKALGRDLFPVYSQYRAESHAIALPDSVLKGEPYKVRSLIILGGSMITAWPQPKVWRETFEALDFMVCIDRRFTADAAYADIVLPATTMYETESYMTYGPIFKLREKVIEPVGEAREDFHILAELAKRLGYGEQFPQTDEERLRYVLKGSGFTLEDVRAAGGEVQVPTVMMEYKKWEKGRLRPDGTPGFNTPTGKFEIASTVLDEHGYDPLPVYTEPAEGPLANPSLATRYPLVFNSGAHQSTKFRSQHHGVKGLDRISPEPVVMLNTKDAEARGIVDGSQVYVESPRGRVRFRAQVTDDIVAGAVEASMGGGGPIGPREWQERNVNELTDIKRYDPISGFPIYKTLLCEVVPAEDGDVVQRRVMSAETGDRTPEKAKQPTAARHVYLDHNASTPVHAEVLEAMLPFLKEHCGNPSSIHSRGSVSHEAVETARRKVARALNCTARRIVFTGGGSEADNLAIKGVAFSARDKGNHIITTSIEHPAVLNTCKALADFGFETTILDVDGAGRVSPDAFATAIRPETILATVMMANNEIGTIQPIAQLAAIAHEHGVLVHTDAIQALGKIPIDVQELGVDLLSISAHKAHGPKGVGALYIKSGVSVTALVDGGGHERGLRSGTENVPGIVGFGKACDLAVQRFNSREPERVAMLRDCLAAGIAKLVPDAVRHGHPSDCLPNTLSMTLPGMRGESLVFMLDRYGVYFSSGSACKSGNPEPSHVLRAIGLSDEAAHCAVRLSLGVDNTEDDIDYTLDALTKVIRDSKSRVRFVACR